MYLFLTESAEKILHKTKHTFYMQANKPNTFLALALQKTNYILKPIRLKLVKDIYTSNPLKILNEFKKNLTELYKEPKIFNQLHLTNLLSTVHLPSLSQTQQESLEKPITKIEI